VESLPEHVGVEDAPSPRRSRLARGRRLIVIAIAAYAAVCLCVGMLQTKLIYFPSQEYDWTPADVALIFEDLTLITRDGVAIAAWYIPHPEAKGTILFCHGNAGNMSHRVGDAKVLHDLGYNFLIFDYRGFGRSAGSPDEAGTYLDAQAAWDYLTKTRGEDPQRVILFGRSLGGAVAIHLASGLADGGPAALVVESTFTSLVDVARLHYPFLPVNWLLTNRYNSISRIGRVFCPKLFIHGTDDELIPIEIGRRLFDAAPQPKLFMETPGGHNSSGFTYTSEYTDRFAEFLEQRR